MSYYIRIDTYGWGYPCIIDEEAFCQAERGENYLNPEDFMFLCEAGSMKEANEYYGEVFSRMANDYIAERYHP